MPWPARSQHSMPRSAGARKTSFGPGRGRTARVSPVLLRARSRGFAVAWWHHRVAREFAQAAGQGLAAVRGHRLQLVGENRAAPFPDPADQPLPSLGDRSCHRDMAATGLSCFVRDSARGLSETPAIRKRENPCSSESGQLLSSCLSSCFCGGANWSHLAYKARIRH